MWKKIIRSFKVLLSVSYCCLSRYFIIALCTIALRNSVTRFSYFAHTVFQRVFLIHAGHVDTTAWKLEFSACTHSMTSCDNSKSSSLQKWLCQLLFFSACVCNIFGGVTSPAACTRMSPYPLALMGSTVEHSKAGVRNGNTRTKAILSLWRHTYL